MTKKEKIQILHAIRLIHFEDDYHGGMGILMKLIGKNDPMENLNCKYKSLIEILGE